MYNRQLLTFIQAAECGSFAKAGEKLFITTASVMKQINALESTMGVQLFRRTNHGSQLTEAGQYVYHEALNLISFSERTIKKAQEIADTEKHIIRIGSSTLRPCKIMIEKWAEIDDGTLPFQIHIVPFSDDNTDLASALKLLGKDFDCFVTSYDPVRWENQYNTFPLDIGDYCLSVSRKHRLAKKSLLTWDDLAGETLMLLQYGLSSEIDKLREEITEHHPDVNIIDTPKYYSTEIFNQCAQEGYLMGSLEIWKDIHPSVVTLPVAWNYKSHYGIVYEKTPSENMAEFIAAFADKKY